ncbi:hypothetical protein IscW_ISCW004811 [Ixodes scapularis]|uniref:Uncharacterized protein n=1 Tax=Ixodes scapularis TaxID=6945 RepID=B7PEQ0_IXOSC|nr:hypothetical protein IscW_ISCW004811 [Ixodes scapularis]|eukprot:XP_002433672.1 hypothetical protein IscW_ISCW004811 [Ixodes scapularis]
MHSLSTRPCTTTAKADNPPNPCILEFSVQKGFKSGKSQGAEPEVGARTVTCIRAKTAKADGLHARSSDRLPEKRGMVSAKIRN